MELSGSINCLIYFKVRSALPYKWGVTANRIKELNISNKKWHLVLLYESPSTGYFLTSEEVNRYLTIWPLANDGDYKPAAGSYLDFNEPFLSFPEFLAYLTQKHYPSPLFFRDHEQPYRLRFPLLAQHLLFFQVTQSCFV